MYLCRGVDKIAPHWCKGGEEGQIECPRETASHKCIGVESIRDCSFISCQEQKQNPCLLENGQNHSSIIYEQNGEGGGRSLNLTKTAKNIWEFSLGMEITLTSDHLPGLLNQTADWESRKVKDTSSNNCKLTIKYSVRSTNNWVQLIWICLQRD